MVSSSAWLQENGEIINAFELQKYRFSLFFLSCYAESAPCNTDHQSILNFDFEKILVIQAKVCVSSELRVKEVSEISNCEFPSKLATNNN